MGWPSPCSHQTDESVGKDQSFRYDQKGIPQGPAVLPGCLPLSTASAVKLGCEVTGEARENIPMRWHGRGLKGFVFSSV